MDVRLVFGGHEGALGFEFAAAAAEVAVHFVRQKFPHLVFAVFFFHDHQGGVFGEAFGEHFRAAHIGADELMGPVLVRHFMGDHKEHEINIVFFHIAQVGDEADAFAVGHGAGECLGKGSIARELDDAALLVVVRSEVGRVVLQRLFDAGQHVGHVVGVFFDVIYLHVYTLPFFAGHLIAGGDEGKEVERGVVELVLEIAPAVFLPAFLEGARCDGDLVAGSADGGAHLDVIGIEAYVALAAGGEVVVV